MPISIKIPTFLETDHLMYDPMGTFQTNTQYSTPVCKRFSSIEEYKILEVYLEWQPCSRCSKHQVEYLPLDSMQTLCKIRKSL